MKHFNKEKQTYLLATENLESLEEQHFSSGEQVQFRKNGGWNGEQGEWSCGTFAGESKRCFFICDTAGKVKEYWRHRIEIRKR